MRDLRIVFDDEHIVVVAKPSGMPSVPARAPLDPPDVAAVLAADFGRVEAVHRLDRDTSGLLVLAKTSAARSMLGRAFERRLVHKIYVAVVHGCPPAESGTIHLPLAPDPWRPPCARPDPILGRRAATRWTTAARVDEGGCGRGLCLLELEPLTGRSHQLRVHLAWLGCPILGDRLYGPTPGTGCRLALHAARLSLPHPAGSGRIDLEAPPDPGAPWEAFIERLRPGAERRDRR